MGDHGHCDTYVHVDLAPGEFHGVLQLGHRNAAAGPVPGFFTHRRDERSLSAFVHGEGRVGATSPVRVLHPPLDGQTRGKITCSFHHCTTIDQGSGQSVVYKVVTIVIVQTSASYCTITLVGCCITRSLYLGHTVYN